MPVKKTYKRRSKRTYRQRKKRVKRKSVYQIAKAAAKSVLKKTAQPNYVRTVYGGYNDTNGQFEDQITFSSGPDGGHLVTDLPQTSVPTTNVGAGQSGSRSDLEISITGIKLSLRFQLPQNVSMAKVKAYLFLDKDAKRRADDSDPLYPVQFKAPDEFYMLRSDPDTKGDLQQISILSQKQVTIRSNPNSSGNNQSRTFRDLNLWWKPKGTGFRLKYIGESADEFLNRAFGWVVKSSYPDNVAGDDMTFGGVITFYYRDYN